jgi:hypothetical protein
MNAHDEDRIKKLLQQALPRVAEDAQPARDLWPAVLRRMDSRTAPLPWFDWALLAGLVAFAAFFPASIPVFLYYL